MQAESMVANRAFPRRHYRKALQLQLFSPANLAECCFLRNRMGLELSFLEDPLLMGMMACRAAKGMGSRIKALARQQADQEAKKARAEGRQEAAVRELIGPRGGLPTLRKDLLKLAALVHVTVTDKMTVDQIRQAVRPVVQEMARDNTPKKSGASSSGLAVESPQRPLEPKSLPAPESPTTTTVDQPAILQEVNSLLANQEEKFQGMLSQLMSHIMTAQQISFQASQMPGAMPMTGVHQHYIGDGVNRDLPMPSALDQSSQQGYTPEEIAQMTQDHREYLKEIGSTGKGYLSD